MNKEEAEALYEDIQAEKEYDAEQAEDLAVE